MRAENSLIYEIRVKAGEDMKYILCYGDSNTWGCVPEKFTRYDFNVRWPGYMKNILGEDYHVYENGLNGRTTVFEDSIEEGRNGRANFEVTLMQNAPIDLLIIMLGTNDVKNRFSKDPWDIGWGLDLLIALVKKSGCGPGGSDPKILVTSPVHLNSDWGNSLHYTVFSEESIEKSKQLSKVFQIIAKRNGCYFIDASHYACPCGDGVHITEEGHANLGKAMAEKVKEIIG